MTYTLAELMSLSQGAKALGICYKTLWAHAQPPKPKFKVRKVGGVLMILRSDVERLKKELKAYHEKRRKKHG